MTRPQAQDTRFDRGSDGLGELLEGRSALGDGAQTEDANGVTMDREPRPGLDGRAGIGEGEMPSQHGG
jgi:hypothetical protein